MLSILARESADSIRSLYRHFLSGVIKKYDLLPQRTGKRGRPASHGKKLSIQDDFTLSDEKIGGYYMAVRRVLTNIFGKKEVLAYVTSPGKGPGSRQLFLSTVSPEQLQEFCTWQEKSPQDQAGAATCRLSP